MAPATRVTRGTVPDRHEPRAGCGQVFVAITNRLPAPCQPLSAPWWAEGTSRLPLSGALLGKVGSHVAQSLVGSQDLALVIGEVADQHVAESDTTQLREGLADLADSPDHE